MEERKNYFEILTSLSFDPPEGNVKKIEAAIKKWYTDVKDSLNNGNNIIKDPDSLKADMLDVLLDPAKRREEAGKLVAVRTAQLNNIIDIMSFGFNEDDTVEVTKGQIRNVMDKLKLSEATVIKIYSGHKKPAYVIKKKEKGVNLNDIFLEATNIRIIKESLKVLSQSKSTYPWVAKVNDLFDVLCYYDGGSDVSKYRKKKTAELLTIAKKGHSETSLDNSPQGHALKDVFANAESKVFNNENNRIRYENSHRLENLEQLFRLLENAPDVFKKDSNFAEVCIKIIQKEFGDYDTCLALYNKKALILNDPYEPLEAKIHVTCGKCNAQNEFRTIGEARKAVCQTCGAKLYVNCPNCKSLIPNSAKRCPSCDFDINEMLFFDDYCLAAENALLDYDFIEAKKQYKKAENAFPGNSRLKTLKMAIDNTEKEYNSSIGEINKLTEAKKYCEADVKIQTLSREKPKLNLERIKADVRKKLSEAQKLMPLDSQTPDVRGNRCLQILEMVCDYKPAIEMLRLCPLSKVRNLRATAVGDNCSITWDSSGDRNVSYTVVRKAGSAPLNHNDGVVLASDLADRMDYLDETIESGIIYGYSVFAKRFNLYSEPASCIVRIYSDPKNVRSSAESGFCRFTWELPKNSVGVRILRRERGIPVKDTDPGVMVLTDKALRNFEDRNIRNGIQYGYRIQCGYTNGSRIEYSQGYTEMLTPERPPVAVRNVDVTIDSGNVTVTWTSPDSLQRTLEIREIPSAAIRDVKNTVGNILSYNELKTSLGVGKLYASGLTTDCMSKFTIPLNSVVVVAVLAVSGSKAVVSAIREIASVDKCEINKTETKMNSGRLKIVVGGNLATNLRKIHYFVGIKTGDSAPWKTVDDAVTGSMKVMTSDQYRKDGVIIIDNPPEDDLYVSVIGEYYLAGKAAFSTVSKCRVSNRRKSVITYYLTWGTGLFSKPKPKNCCLHVFSDAQETPELTLAYRVDGRPPMSLDNHGIEKLFVIPPMEGGFKHGRYEHEFRDDIWKDVPPGAKLRLLLADEDSSEYDIKPPTEGAEVPAR